MDAKWNDIEKVLNAGTLEAQDRETLRAFARVEPPPSRNPAFHERFRDAKERIRHRLRELDGDGAAVRVNPNSGGLGPWFVQVSRLIREMRKKALDAQKTKAKTTIASIKKIPPGRLRCPVRTVAEKSEMQPSHRPRPAHQLRSIGRFPRHDRVRFARD